LEKNLIANGGKIINVSSRAGQLGSTPTKSLSPLLDNADRNKVDSIANDFIDATSDPDNVEARGFPKNTYKVSKATLNAYGRALAKEQSGRVHVYNYCPGWCQTGTYNFCF
jgi:NAD(P)-dependent dehydrogenase (short-subunit alcohol dehydrogenase family)